MYLQHSPGIWRDFPELAAGVIFADGITERADVDELVARFLEVARARLAEGRESEFGEIQAWRRVFSRMGLKPTQYRCASESLLRRLRQEGTLPRSHPLVDLCNAVSVAFAIPVAALDVAAIAGDLEVRRATGEEKYQTFGGETEHPASGEVIFADEAGQAHARRWTNRQSGLSAIRPATTTALIVTEAVHASAAMDIRRLAGALAAGITGAWRLTPAVSYLTATSPRGRFGGPGESVAG